MKHGVLFLVVVVAFALSGCGSSGGSNGHSNSDTQSINTDPSQDWVKVFKGSGWGRDGVYGVDIFKRCDGPNLVYVSDDGFRDVGGGTSVIANSPECQ